MLENVESESMSLGVGKIGSSIQSRARNTAFLYVLQMSVWLY